MSSERHGKVSPRGQGHRNPGHRPHPEAVPPWRRETHPHPQYQTRPDQTTRPSPHQSRNDPPWTTGIHDDDRFRDFHRFQGGVEAWRERDPQPSHAHPRSQGLKEWREQQSRYPDDASDLDSFTYNDFQARSVREDDLPVNQKYASAYGNQHASAYGNQNYQRSKSGLRRYNDERPESWYARDGRQQRTSDKCDGRRVYYREEHHTPTRESAQTHSLRRHEMNESGFGNSPRRSDGGNGDREKHRRHGSEPSRSGWEEDIINMLPSQVDLHKGTLRFRGTLRAGRRTSHTSHMNAWDPQEPEEGPKTETEVLELLSSLRDQPWPLNQRRETKKLLHAKLTNTEVKWYSTQPVTKAMKKGKSSLVKVFKANYVWGQLLKRIEGKFGSSVYAFFNFLRAIIHLNILVSLVLVGGIVVPSVLLADDPKLQEWGWMSMDDSDGNCTSCVDITLEANDQFRECNQNYTDNLKGTIEDHKWKYTKLVQDFLQGTGFLEWTILFSGRYPAAVVNSKYLISLAYLLSVFAVYLISFLFVVYFVAKFFRQSPVQMSEKSTLFSNIVFTGWDYTVREAKPATTVHICITGEVKAAFDDDQFLKRKLRRTKRDYVILILTRIFINILLIALTIGGWVGIYYFVDVSQKNLDGSQNNNFFWEYAPTLTVEAFNFLYPMLFTFVVPYEQYRGDNELLITLIRSVFVRLTSLIVLMFTNLIAISQESRSCDPKDPFICWETRLGQQVYSLLVLGAIVQTGMTFVVDVIRKALTHLDIPLLKKLCQVEFFVPTHVLDIVYFQCLCWLSIIHAPILVIVCSLYFCLLFGFKLFTVSFTCVPATRVFRASRSSAMFMTILCLAFLLCLTPYGMALLYLRPSLACSPFRGLDYSWQVLTYYVCEMTGTTYWIRWVVFTIDETVVVVVLVLAALILFVYYLSLVSVRNSLITRLEKKLKDTAKDKIFLMEKYNGKKNDALQY